MKSIAKNQKRRRQDASSPAFAPRRLDHRTRQVIRKRVAGQLHNQDHSQRRYTREHSKQDQPSPPNQKQQANARRRQQSHPVRHPARNRKSGQQSQPSRQPKLSPFVPSPRKYQQNNQRIENQALRHHMVVIQPIVMSCNREDESARQHHRLLPVRPLRLAQHQEDSQRINQDVQNRRNLSHDALDPKHLRPGIGLQDVQRLHRQTKIGIQLHPVTERVGVQEPDAFAT